MEEEKQSIDCGIKRIRSDVDQIADESEQF